MSNWDYIVVGAGSSGCVVASRLSENPKLKVLLLEAGGLDRGLSFDAIALSTMKLRGNPVTDWMYMSEEDPSRGGRRDPMSRGKVIGGSSSINGAVYVRGNRGDYDHWRQMGNAGWDYESLVPVFEKMEQASGALASSGVYGHRGPIRISESRGPHGLAKTFIAAMSELGVPYNPGYNGEQQMGASEMHVTQHRGRRWSAARGYLRPAMSRANLAVQTGVLVRRIVMEGKRAVGVEIEQDGASRIERCSGEVVISASTFNSPKLLMLSGIGEPEHLRSLGIGVVHANAHVGQNLHDHPAVVVQAFVNRRTVNRDTSGLRKLLHGFRFAAFGSGPVTHHWPAVAFVKTRPELEYPDVQYHFGPFIANVTSDGLRMLDRSGVTVLTNVSRSQSRGFVKLASARPEDAPLIQQNLLASRNDVETLARGIGFARRVFQTNAFRDIVEQETAPGSTVQSDEDLAEYVRAKASSAYHPCGTVKMGTDPAAVVDPALRVIGVERLRVIDSSIIPQIPSGNINAVSMVIGEKGAEAILHDLPR